MMHRKEKVLGVLSVVTLFFAVLYFFTREKHPDGLTRVTMFDVGQGDSFFIQTDQGTQLLIDGGRDERVLVELSKMLPVGDRFIDVVLATHPDADHIGGLPLVLKRYGIGVFLTSKVFTDTKTFSSLFQMLQEKNIPSYYALDGVSLQFNDSNKSRFSVLFPDRDTTNWETNAASVVGLFQSGDRSVLFTGDSPASIEAHMVAKYKSTIAVDMLKLGHHGSKTSSSESFLRTTYPALALISAGVQNRYGHPAPEVLERLKMLGIPWVSTMDQGTVTFTTNGKKWFKK